MCRDSGSPGERRRHHQRHRDGPVRRADFRSQNHSQTDGNRGQRTTQTSSAGLYSLSALPAGSYDVTVEAAGFKQAKFAAVPWQWEPS